MTMPSKPISLLLLGCFSLVACSSAPIEPADMAGKLKDKLTTDIRDNGLKLFTYRAKMVDDRYKKDNAEPVWDQQMRAPQQAPQQGGRQGGQMPREQHSNRENQQEELEIWAKQVELGLEKTLEMTGYCREGYFELSRMIDSGKGEIRGECKEGANEADKQKFVRY